MPAFISSIARSAVVASRNSTIFSIVAVAHDAAETRRQRHARRHEPERRTGIGVDGACTSSKIVASTSGMSP